MASLLVELNTEELPPKALKTLSEAFAAGIEKGLRSRNFLSSDSQATAFGAPRRLAVHIAAVAARSPDQPFRQKLVPVAVGLDAQGNATPALLKKLATLGANVDHRLLKRESDGKQDVLVYEGTQSGTDLADGLQAALDEAIGKLPIPKVMSYQLADGTTTVQFVRPAHRLVALHGAQVVPVAALGLQAGRETFGHRFHTSGPLAIRDADSYARQLEVEGKVIASFGERRARIEALLTEAAGRLAATPVMPGELLDEVTALVEWPVVYAGTFDRAFLAVPQECLILTMQQNQKYFALADASGRLEPRFLVVANLAAEDPAAIVGGNERVLRARLADARFFYDQDRKAKLETRLPRLDAIVYHNKLGSQGQRVARLRALARRIAPVVGADAALADRAACLAKADLVTDMVGEFPELQGLMGRYYALHDGEPDSVADAIAQHYAPRFAGDALPDGPVAQAVALADKLEALAGLFGVGAQPTGDKDPFGLRRAALGVLRILIEKRVAAPLSGLVEAAFGTFVGVAAVKPDRQALSGFLADRLRGHLREQGYSANQIEAVLAAGLDRVDLVPDRLAAVKAFEALPEADALAAANKRIVNILRKSGAESAAAVDRALLAPGAEHDLWLAFQSLAPDVDAACGRGDWTAALKALATAKPVVDRFFDDVMVMADDPAVRGNRLALLAGVAATMNRVADISRLAR